MDKPEIIHINDFTIILNHNKLSKTTMVESYISHGFINENVENAGISHLLEHMVTEGWKKCTEKGCSDYWKKKGVLTNASTGQTNVRYYMHGLSKFSKEMIDYMKFLHYMMLLVLLIFIIKFKRSSTVVAAYFNTIYSCFRYSCCVLLICN